MLSGRIRPASGLAGFEQNEQRLGVVFTASIVVATLWLLGALDWTGEFVGIEHPWLNSPIGVGD
jgi:hypothetical protein